jgi:hypothetical protein
LSSKRLLWSYVTHGCCLRKGHFTRNEAPTTCASQSHFI